MPKTLLRRLNDSGAEAVLTDVTTDVDVVISAAAPDDGRGVCRKAATLLRRYAREFDAISAMVNPFAPSMQRKAKQHAKQEHEIRFPLPATCQYQGENQLLRLLSSCDPNLWTLPEWERASRVLYYALYNDVGWNDITDALAELCHEQREFWYRVQATANTSFWNTIGSLSVDAPAPTEEGKPEDENE